VDLASGGAIRVGIDELPRRRATDAEFNTNPAPGQTVKVAEVGPYSIELLSLEPYPQTHEPIAFKDYRVTLVVHRGYWRR